MALELELEQIASEEAGPEAEEAWDIDLSGGEPEDGEDPEAVAADTDKAAAHGESAGPAQGAPAGEARTEAPLLLNHLGQLRPVSREEAVALAQKGLDYDFVKARLAEAREKLARYEAAAVSGKPAAGGGAGGSRTGSLEAESGAGAESVPGGSGPAAAPPAAVDTARLSPGAGDLRGEEAPSGGGVPGGPETGGQKSPDPEAGAGRKRREAAEFVRLFPGVVPSDIPSQVWEEVRRGTALSAAYLKQRNRALEAELSALRQDRENRSRAPGGVSTAGSRREAADPILAALEE